MDSLGVLGIYPWWSVLMDVSEARGHYSIDLDISLL